MHLSWSQSALLLAHYFNCLDNYFLRFPNDRPALRALVTLTWLFEVVQTVLATRDAWLLFVTGWGNVEELTVDDFVWFFVPIQSSISESFNSATFASCSELISVGVMTQLFFAWRIWVLSRHSIVVPALAFVVGCV
jgi:hypothetical protein